MTETNQTDLHKEPEAEEDYSNIQSYTEAPDNITLGFRIPNDMITMITGIVAVGQDNQGHITLKVLDQDNADADGIPSKEMELGIVKHSESGNVLDVFAMLANGEDSELFKCLGEKVQDHEKEAQPASNEDNTAEDEDPGIH